MKIKVSKLVFENYGLQLSAYTWLFAVWGLATFDWREALIPVVSLSAVFLVAWYFAGKTLQIEFMCSAAVALMSYYIATVIDLAIHDELTTVVQLRMMVAFIVSLGILKILAYRRLKIQLEYDHSTQNKIMAVYNRQYKLNFHSLTLTIFMFILVSALEDKSSVQPNMNLYTVLFVILLFTQHFAFLKCCKEEVKFHLRNLIKK